MSLVVGDLLLVVTGPQVCVRKDEVSLCLSASPAVPLIWCEGSGEVEGDSNCLLWIFPLLMTFLQGSCHPT